MEPLIVAGHDISSWLGVAGHRILDDGRILILYRQIYNWKLTVSLPEHWPTGWSDAW